MKNKYTPQQLQFLKSLDYISGHEIKDLLLGFTTPDVLLESNDYDTYIKIKNEFNNDDLLEIYYRFKDDTQKLIKFIRDELNSIEDIHQFNSVFVIDMYICTISNLKVLNKTVEQLKELNEYRIEHHLGDVYDINTKFKSICDNKLFKEILNDR